MKGEGKMDTRVLKVFTIILISALLASAFPVVSAQPQVYMWIEPPAINLSTQTVSPGYRFKVTVMLHSEKNVYSYQIGLKYDREQLKCTRAGFTQNFTAGHDTQTAGPIIDTSYLGNGTVLATESCKGEDFIPGPREGSLLWVEFEVIKAPGKYEELTSTISISAFYPGDTWVKDPDLNDILEEARDCTYKYTWAPPTTKPRMAVSPTLVELGPYERVIGKDFDIQVFIKNLAVAWDLTNAGFTLNYNDTVIDVIGGAANVTIAPLWGTSSVTVTPGQINIAVSDPSTKPMGDVLVATIKFTVLIQGESPPLPVGYADISDLTFSNVELYNHVGPIPTDPAIPGKVKVYAFIVLPLAWLEISPAKQVVYACHVYKYDVIVKGLDEHWYVVLFQFRVLFDSSLVDVVKVEEGPWFPEGPWNKYGTSFGSIVDYDDPIYGDNVVVYGLIYPNPNTGEWDQEVFPSADDQKGAVMASIYFKVISDFPDINGTLKLVALWSEGHEAFVDKDSNYVEADYNKFVH
ncbi:MAG: cohesin domain-containing protein, partial [Nitrososphaerota archaeon]